MTLSPKTLRILIGIYKWFYFILCLSFYFYQLPSFPLYTASEAVSNIHKILSINSFSDVFMFVDLHVDHKNSWIYSYRTGERIHGELLYISISNEDSQLVNFFTHIADCNICIAPISGSILDSDTSLHSTMAFSPLTNYDYDYFSFYQPSFPFHCAAFDNSCKKQEGLCDTPDMSFNTSFIWVSLFLLLDFVTKAPIGIDASIFHKMY